MTDARSTQPIWSATTDAELYGALTGDQETDVVVIGGGITGITAAGLLRAAGKRVIVVDMDRVGSGETGHTTAHLTEVIDTRYATLMSDFGDDGAELVARASREAIAQIEAIAQTIRCDFERVPGFLYAEDEGRVEELRRETDAMARVGIAASFIQAPPLPFAVAGAIRVDHQAQLQPRKYVLGLAEHARAAGCVIAERTKVLEIEDGAPCRVVTDHGVITATDVIVAANVPIANRLFLHTKLAAYRSYAIAGRATKPLERALYWDTADPYHYVRTFDSPEGPLVIVGGEDHKTGQDHDTEERFSDLEHFAYERFGVEKASYRWSGQIIESVDGLPFIGKNSASEHVYVATGFSGNGMTFGVVAAQILTDAILARENPYRDLFHATRIKPLAAVATFVTENVDFPAHLVGDAFSGGDVESVEDVPIASGRLVRVKGRLLAVYRDDHDRVHAMSSICTHMKCRVKWNSAETSWDCPCHGARFDARGKVLNGPALTDLESVDIDEPIVAMPIPISE
ncbi:FAD-dependent oxidoreductase [soil metagenome]